MTNEDRTKTQAERVEEARNATETMAGRYGLPKFPVGDPAND